MRSLNSQGKPKVYVGFAKKDDRSREKGRDICPDCGNKVYFLEASFLCPICGYSIETIYT